MTALVPRLLLCHKHRTSARLHFLRFAHGLLGFSPLPAGMHIVAARSPGTVVPHPAAWVHAAERSLGLTPHALAAEPDFHAEARLEADAIPILLASFTALDLPRELATRLGARWQLITEAKDLSPAERELLRLGYEFMIG